ncbi:hypothetical protein THRCLA_08028 [Thraustotheca clavata]|uniref:Uncharacterized protein n=1 Tax=Thraustotheca clavata TaxID=74557 RepID=A0A1V9ZAQ6_9STRA|nr:hypothetical protein THRCLA_08028 [Thraustotheca clavata]
MGRYTTEQSYADNEAKVGTVPYDVVKDKSEVAVKDADAGPKEKFKFNKVENVAGSTAGAGSGEFHMYRAARRREMERLGGMEAEHKKKLEDEAFQQKRKQMQEELDEKTRQKAAKRRRKQENAKIRKMMGNTTSKEDHVSSAQPDLMPGGVDEIPNDGSFLATILAKKENKNAT